MTTATRKKNPHAVALGRLGGSRGGLARAAAMDPERRTEIARRAALARWARYRAKAEHTNLRGGKGRRGGPRGVESTA